MPRIVKENEEYRLTYGIDHISGNFIQVEDKKKNEVVRGSIGLSSDDLIQIAESYGFDMESEKDTGDGFEGQGCGGGCETCVRLRV